jgi:hypothetical protein
LRIGAAKKEAGRAYGFVKIHIPASALPKIGLFRTFDANSRSPG